MGIAGVAGTGTGPADLGKTEFPPAWDDDKIIGHILDVARAPDDLPVFQANRRWRLHGQRNDLRITVIVQPDGGIWSAWPDADMPGSGQEPEGDTVNESEVIERVEALPDRYAGRVRPQDLDGMRSMADGGEWQELLDVLIASLAMTQARVTSSEGDELKSLAEAMDLPTDQLTGLNVQG